MFIYGLNISEPSLFKSKNKLLIHEIPWLINFIYKCINMPRVRIYEF